MNNRPSIFRPIVLSFLMAFPFGFGVGFLAVGVNEGWREYREFLGENISTGYYHNHYLSFLADGTPTVSDHRSVGPRHSDHVDTHMDGTRLTPEERRNFLDPQDLRNGLNRRQHPFNREPFEELLRKRNRWSRIQDPLNPSIHWTWEPAPGSSTGRVLIARYLRFDSPISFISPEGFSDELPESSQGFFNPGDARHDEEMVVFRSAGKLIAINLSKRTVTTIADIDPRQAWTILQRDEQLGWQFAIGTLRAIRIYSDHGEKLLDFAARATAEFGTPNLYTPTDGQFIITQIEDRDKEQLPNGGRLTRFTTVATWLDETGKVTRTLKFPNEYRLENVRSSSFIVNSVDQFMEKVGPGLVVPAPAAMCGGIFVLAPWVSSEIGREQSYEEVVIEAFDRIPYGIPVSALVALCCTIACWRRQVRYQAEWTKTWTVFVFLFGLPAWFAWRVHRRWPPLDLAGAPEAEFIGPEPNGLEIR